MYGMFIHEWLEFMFAPGIPGHFSDSRCLLLGGSDGSKVIGSVGYNPNKNSFITTWMSQEDSKRLVNGF